MLLRRPKLLFLSCCFPPLSIIGCIRTWNIAKYLTRLGWEVTVVTPHPSLWQHVENPEEIEVLLKREGIQRILTGCRWRCLLAPLMKSWDRSLGRFIGGFCRILARHLDIDSGIGWLKEAERACSTLAAHDVDLILATGSPFTAFRLAKRLANRLSCPYVLDYRDLWTENLHPSRARPNRLSTIKEEASLLSGCAAITIVSRSWSVSLERRFGLGSKLHVVTNGYNSEELPNLRPYNFDHFAIVYTGIFYPPVRVITPIMIALQRLKKAMSSRSREWYFHYYGPHGNHIHEEATKHGVMDRVILHGKVPRSEALAAVRAANIAVVITSIAEEGSLADNGMITGKVFEPLRLGTPVLLIAPSGSDARAVIESTESGHSFTASDVDGMVAFLTDVMDGRVAKPKIPEAYSWVNIAQKMDCVLRAAMSTQSRYEQEVRIPDDDMN
jgi:glycosyltransferase involved in cell wall biosynthesis